MGGGTGGVLSATPLQPCLSGLLTKSKFFNILRFMSFGKLQVGRRYRTNGGYLIRTITALEDDVVHYVDQCGPGRCKKTTFAKRCYEAVEDDPAIASESHAMEPQPLEAIDLQATKELLEIFNGATTNVAHWILTMERSALQHEAVLTTGQAHCLEQIIDEFGFFSEKLRLLQPGLAR